MQYEIPQVFSWLFFVILVMSLATVNAKPQRFLEATQGFSNDQDSSFNSLADTGLRPWQLEILAQKMAELNQIRQMSNLNGDDLSSTFDRALRSGNEIKRQSRYRLCYFNPVSCFKK